MLKFWKIFGLSMVSACLMSGGADAATGRGDYANVRATTVGAAAPSTARMPSMPTLPLIAVGNVATDVNPNATPSGGTTTPSTPNTPDTNVPGPDVPNGTQFNECPDGGVKDSEYTIDSCMRDVLACVNNGALPNGLNDMFNEDLRASIINGMGLCYNQVDKCVRDVRRNCKRVYLTRADVWIDFNSRKVQPEYYSFVLRNTGLTPVQAENTCLLLDRNTYGKSFAAVNASDKVTGEYDKNIGAYNEQLNGTLSKSNPLGVTVNTNGAVDAKRGHYARWDAATAQCLIRVAAYNKDKQITNSWLFGAIGDETPAEVWKVAGETFTCNKDLFGFSLMKDTATAALLGVGGGTIVGAAAGAGIGAGVANKYENVCSEPNYRSELLTKIKNSGKINILSNYLDDDITRSTTSIDDDTCNKIIELADVYAEYDARVAVCEDALGDFNVAVGEAFSIQCNNGETLKACLQRVLGDVPDGHLQYYADFQKMTKDRAIAGAVEVLEKCFADGDGDGDGIYTPKSEAGCAVAREIMLVAGLGPLSIGQCVFKAIDKTSVDSDRNIACTVGNSCISFVALRRQLDQLQSVLSAFEIKPAQSRGAIIGKGAGIGAAVGAGAGGIATAITALVEHDNINCRVGDGLGQVGLNKSYSIDGLKDLYVKWNLNLPDTQVLGGGASVNNLQSWTDTCKTYVSESACNNAQFYYKNASGALEWIYSACTFDKAGASCDPNQTLIQSYGVQ